MTITEITDEQDTSFVRSFVATPEQPTLTLVESLHAVNSIGGRLALDEGDRVVVVNAEPTPEIIRALEAHASELEPFLTWPDEVFLQRLKDC